MANDADVLQLLGKIDGKLDQALEAAREHREDDKRRFTEVHAKIDEHKEQVSNRLAEHDKDINQAKGGRAVLLWLITGGAASIGACLALLAQAYGGK